MRPFRSTSATASSQGKAGQGRFYQKAVSKVYAQSFEGMVRVMKDYVVERMSYMNSRAADAAIPNRPTISSMSPPGFPINALTFRTGSFADPQGSHTFGAVQWRIAEVSAASQGAAARRPGPNAGPVFHPGQLHVEVRQGPGRAVLLPGLLAGAVLLRFRLGVGPDADRLRRGLHPHVAGRYAKQLHHDLPPQELQRLGSRQLWPS